MERVILKRMVFKVTSKCSLKCKLCLAYIPYYDKHEDVSYSDAKNILDRFFSIVDEVGTFSVTGGEPLLNRDLPKIMLEICKYRRQIIGTIDIVTNGTLDIEKDLMDIIITNKDKIRVIISNYGPLSRKIDILRRNLIDNGINYRLEEYYDVDNLKNGGWLDYRDHSLKHKTEKEIKRQAKDCFFRQGHYYEINQGELHLCSRSFYRMMKGIIPKNDNQYINLLDDKKNVEEEKQKMLYMDALEYLDSCAYCDGNKEDSKRYKPAEQL